ncbi:MAG TPA: twin-arginine translocase TatA/TatE family subunit [Deltaproteobacteria bacterium]|nr:twin-arginine translocase TatA/TatE family subunit [Deltaproteobacteria bacterium]
MLVAGFLGGMIGAPELAIILVLVLILFGAGRLPQVLESFGKGIKAFRNASRDDLDDPLEVSEPAKRELSTESVAEAQEVEQKQPQAAS